MLEKSVVMQHSKETSQIRSHIQAQVLARLLEHLRHANCSGIVCITSPLVLAVVQTTGDTQEEGKQTILLQSPLCDYLAA